MINVAIPTDLEQFVESVLHRGEYRDAAEVVGEALRLLKQRDQLHHDVRAGLEQLDRGQYTEYDESALPQFLTNIEAEQQRRFGENTDGP